MTVWIGTRSEFMEATKVLLQYSGSIETLVRRASLLTGYCRACERVTNMRVTAGEPPGSWRNLLEGMICACGLNGRNRLALAVLDELLLVRDYPDALVLERLTPLYTPLAARLRGLIGTEYVGSEVPPGASVERGGIAVRSENMMALTFPPNSLDIVMHFDILEHVPDWRLALQECFRVLRTGGMMLFTLPFYDQLDRNIVRAEFRENQIHHLMEPAYHGNPISNEGSLVFIHPSWEIYEYVSSIGFASVKIALCYDPIQAIFSNGCPYPDGHMWPLVFVLTK